MDTFSLTSVNYCLFGLRETLLGLTAAPLLPFLLGPKLLDVNGKVDTAHDAARGLPVQESVAELQPNAAKKM